MLVQLNQADYPRVKFWERNAWNKTDAALADIDVDSNVTERGPARQAQGVNVSFTFVEDKYGVCLNGYAIRDINATAREIWQELKRRGKAPKTWLTGASTSIKNFYRTEMYQRHEELRFCQNHWKVDFIASHSYSGWHRRHVTQSCKEDTGDDIPAQGVSRKRPLPSNTSSKRSKKLKIPVAPGPKEDKSPGVETLESSTAVALSSSTAVVLSSCETETETETGPVDAILAGSETPTASVDVDSVLVSSETHTEMASANGVLASCETETETETGPVDAILAGSETPTASVDVDSVLVSSETHTEMASANGVLASSEPESAQVDVALSFSETEMASVDVVLPLSETETALVDVPISTSAETVPVLIVPAPSETETTPDVPPNAPASCGSGDAANTHSTTDDSESNPSFTLVNPLYVLL